MAMKYTPFPLPQGLDYDIVHLERLNILVAIRVWGTYWATHKLLIHYGNRAVVIIMKSCKTRDLTLAAICRNILMECARFDIDLHTVHIQGKRNVVADALSQLSLNPKYMQVVQEHVPNYVWVNTTESLMHIK